MFSTSEETLPFLLKRNNLFYRYSSKKMLRKTLFASNDYESKKSKPIDYANSRWLRELLTLQR